LNFKDSFLILEIKISIFLKRGKKNLKLIMFVIVFMVLMVSGSMSINLNDICLINPDYSSLLGCTAELPYRCNENYCTRNKETCDLPYKRNNMRFFQNIWSRNNIFSSLQDIKLCPVGIKTQICLNNYLCSKRKMVAYCFCSAQFNYACDKKYCASSKRACEQFIALRETVLLDVNICGKFSFLVL
jgi:hypothetical protein